MKITTKEFVEKARKVHGSKYDYSKVEYINNKTKVCIICPIHGEFTQTPHNHISQKQGCPVCGGSKQLTTEEFIEKAKLIHGYNYDYSKVKYVNSVTKVCIICPIHGEFWQKSSNHLRGCKCPKCTHRSYRYSIDEFIEKSCKMHGNKYDYSKTEYTNNKIKVRIICPEHGEFWMTPNSHLSGQGCPKCKANKLSNIYLSNTSSFIEKSIKKHGNKYDYTKVDYKGNKIKVCIICPEHSEFWQTPHEHLDGCGCPTCAYSISKNEDEIYNFIKTLCTDAERRNRKIISPQEIDIYIPSLKIGFEYNGLIWHSEKFGKDRFYHINKTKLCKQKGVTLFHIFEDEYKNYKEVILSKIKQIIGQNNNSLKIDISDCHIKEMNDDASVTNFLERNSIHENVSNTIHICAYYNNEIISVISFKMIDTNTHTWKIVNMSNDITKNCNDVIMIIFDYFVEIYKPETITIFKDLSLLSDYDDDLLKRLGFIPRQILPPSYRYINGNKIFGKLEFRNNVLNSVVIDESTEKVQAEKLGYYRIWDCGLKEYIWYKKN